MYLIKQRGLSNNTLKSYRDTMVQLLEFIECKYKISINKIDSKAFSKNVILEFMYYLEQERKISVASRNQRLAAIHSFFRYLQKKDLSCYNLCSEILDIEFKRKADTIINYMSLEEVRFLFTVPNLNTKKGLRELCILVTLYESGARVQELIDVRVSDVSLHPLSTIILHGKGNKDRLVPISNDVRKIIKTYLNDFPSNNESYLFKNRQGFRLTRGGIQYIVDKNILLGKEKMPAFYKNRITNHSFRHSKSMHLLEAGVNLVYIRDFLGHSSVTTTELYARANSEIKRKAIEKHSISLNIKQKYTADEKKQLINWLKKQI
jgi:site-specific recombinase XerD